MKAWLRLLVGGALFLAQTTEAHFGERTDSLWGFTSRSDFVLVATVLDAKQLEEKGHTPWPGALRLRVDEGLRGDGHPAETLVLVEGMHQPRYTAGERVLVFSERRDGMLRTLQSRSEKVPVAGEADPVVETVRRYLAILHEAGADERTTRLRDLTLELLEHPAPRLHQDAIFDLTRRSILDGVLRPADVARLGALGRERHTPLVVREGVAAKLGALAGPKHPGALPSLIRMTDEARNPAVRVAALLALRRTGRPEASGAMIRALADPSPDVRRAAVDGLAQIHAPGAREPLERVAAGDADRRVRHAAKRALRELSVSAARDHETSTVRPTNVTR